MASYIELRNLFDSSDIRNKVTTATVIAAHNLLTGAPSANDRAFADAVFSNPKSVGNKVYMAVIAANKSATVSQIEGASDSAIQTNVDGVIPSLVAALAGA